MTNPISYAQAIILGLVQGIAEPFPISSLGHAVIIPGLAHWSFQRANDDRYLTFLVATHLATAIVLFLIFRRDWYRIIRGMGRSLAAREITMDDPGARLGWVLVVGTIPAGLLGLIFEKKLRSIFASPAAGAAFLIVNGVLLLAFERMRRRPPRAGDYLGDADGRIGRLPWRHALGVGTSQAAALIPGISRSGVTMGGGLLVGLSNEDAARYSFLLATPIIGAAALLKVPELFGHKGDGLRGPALVGGLCAAATTFLAVKFLMKWFETNRLTPFGIYCIVAGSIATIALAV